MNSEKESIRITADEPFIKSVRVRLVRNLLFDAAHSSGEIARIYSDYFRNLLRRNRYSSEMYYWERKYYEHSVSRIHPVWWYPEYSVDKSPEILKALETLKKDFSEEIRIADIGSGPVTSLFEMINVRRWNIVCVDPLADFYNSLNQRYGIETKTCIAGTGERLLDIFDKGTFHLVLSQNAIDHSESPVDFLNNMSYVLKPGGFLCIYGATKEGSATKWAGLHKWDVEVVDDNLVLSNRDRTIRGLKIIDSSKFEVWFRKTAGHEPGDKYSVIYRKKHPDTQDSRGTLSVR